MLVHDVLVAERRRVATVLDGLTAAEWNAPSLCTGWSVGDVAAHLITYLHLGQAKIYLGIVCTGADFDRWNRALTRRIARREPQEIVATLRRRAASRTTIPRSGYDPLLADVILHDLDIRLPLGVAREAPSPGLPAALDHLARRPAPGFALGGRLRDLRLDAPDLGWSAGSGALVRGPAEALLLAMGGRTRGLERLEGEGVPLLRARLATPTSARLVERLKGPLRTLLDPPPPDRGYAESLSGTAREAQLCPTTQQIPVFANAPRAGCAPTRAATSRPCSKRRRRSSAAQASTPPPKRSPIWPASASARSTGTSRSART